jgi:hypothetical protein
MINVVFTHTKLSRAISVLDRIVWVNSRNKKPLDRIYRMNRIS